jgi:hypothetical protein
MKLKIAVVLILTSGLLFFGSSLVKSEDEIVLTVTGKAENKKQNIKENILEQKENRIAIKEELQLEKETKKAEAEKIREEIKEKREAFKETLQVEREERKTKIEEMRLTFKEKRDDFKEKIETIKDEKKKQLTEKIDNRMSTVNKNQTARMLKALEKLTEHVNKLEERVVNAKENGVDVSAVELLISTAKTAISDALAIVEEQAANDYAFTITDEANLGQSIKASYEILNQDLKKAQESLVKAKEDVVAAFKAAGELEKITPTPTVATP